MLRALCRPSVLSLLALCLFTISACAPSYVNTEDLGQRASRAEILDHYSGNSVSFLSTTEVYFAPDGTVKLVRQDVPGFAFGKWEITNNGLLLITAENYFVADGQVSIGGTTRESSIVYIQPDGTAVLDRLGGRNITEPRPTPGFGAESRFNELRRMAGL